MDQDAAKTPTNPGFDRQTLVRTLATWRGEPTDVAIVERLLQEAELAQEGYAPNTLRARVSDLKVWSSWCRGRVQVPLPARPETVAEFVRDMKGAGKGAATIRRYLDTLAYVHRVAGLPNPKDSRPVTLVLRGLTREFGTRGVQAEPITEAMVEAILPTISDTPRGRRDRALLLLSRDLLARASELVALQVADVTPGSNGFGIVSLTRQKTSADPTPKAIRARTLAAVQRYLRAAGVVDGPLFRSLRRNGQVRSRALHDNEVARILRRLVAAAHLPTDRVSGHSCRVGMAQDLAAAGATLPQLMEAGDWRSPTMPARYTERLAAERGAVVTLFERERSKE